MKLKIIYTILFILLLNIVSAARITDIIEQTVPVFYCSNTYELEAIYISVDKVKFRLNNETSDLLGYHDLWKFQEGSSIYVREILEEEALEAPDRVSIRFYPEVCILAAEEEVNMTEEATVEEIAEVPPPIPILYEEAPPALPEEEKSSLFARIINWFRNWFT